MTTKTLKCSNCKVAAKTVENPEPNDMVVCPKCGASETHKDLERSISEQAEYAIAKKLEDTFKGMARGNKNMSYKGARLKKPRAKFTIDLKL